MYSHKINGLPIYNESGLRELSTDTLRSLYADARGVGLNGYAERILNAWQYILETTYPRRIDRQS